MEKDAISRRDFIDNKKLLRPSKAYVEVWRDGVLSGTCGVYNDINKEQALKELEKHKKDYSKFDKNVVLKLMFDGEEIV